MCYSEYQYFMSAKIQFLVNIYFSTALNLN
jgi:hypothetical protein